MAETRLIQKQLAGAQDLITGIGKVVQKRASQDRTITKLNVSELQGAIVVDTIEGLNNINVSDLGATKTAIVHGEGIYNYTDAGWVNTYNNIMSVPNRAALKAKIGQIDGEAIWQSDIGLMYIWHSNGVVDNGGTQIGTGAGWVAIYTGAVDVKWFDDPQVGFDKSLDKNYTSSDKSKNSIKKIWKRTYGTKDNAATLSVTSGTDNTEPTTQVLGFSTPSDVSTYPDRDHVAVFAQIGSTQEICDTTNTVFTATTVISNDFTNAIADGQIKVGMLIDVKADPKITGTIESFSDNTITVTAWYIVDGSKDTTTPENGTQTIVNPVTKIWAHNANISIGNDSNTTSATGFELGLLNNKQDYIGTIFDAVNLGTYKGKESFISRGNFNIGFRSGPFKDFGFVSEDGGIGLYCVRGNIGVQVDHSTVGFEAKNCTDSAFMVRDTNNTILSNIDAGGKNVLTKYKYRTFSDGDTIGTFDYVCSSVVASDTTIIHLPSPSGNNTNRVLYLKNPKGSTVSVYFAGLVEGATGSISLAAGAAKKVISDGAYWIPIS